MSDRLIAIRVTEEQYRFLQGKGSVPEYIRVLIRERMEKERRRVQGKGKIITLQKR